MHNLSGKVTKMGKHGETEIRGQREKAYFETLFKQLQREKHIDIGKQQIPGTRAAWEKGQK